MNSTFQLSRAARLIIVLILLGIVIGCSGQREIRGIPPVIQLAQLQLEQEHVVLALRFRNGNDSALTGGKLQFQLTLGGQVFAIYNDTPDIDVIAHSAEELRVRVTPLRPESLDRLRAMAARGQGNLQWQMDGSLNLDQKIPPLFSNQGRLFPVPGRDDLFR